MNGPRIPVPDIVVQKTQSNDSKNQIMADIASMMEGHATSNY